MTHSKLIKENLEKMFTNKVIGLRGTDYEGLIGRTDRILVGNERETENESLVDIVVDFEPFDHMKIEESHPNLNGTSISQVICGEDELGFFKGEEDEFAFTIEGKAVCPRCYEPLEKVVETQYDDIAWNWDNSNKSYKKSNSGDSDGKKCSSCCGPIQDVNEFFGY